MTAETAVRVGDMVAYVGRRRSLLRELTGSVLEIGAGTGANFADYAPGIRWIGLEPNHRRRRRLAAAAIAHGHHEPILTVAAEEIPLPARSVDAVVSTIVLCSVTDQDRCLAEIARVLRPGGRFVFAEHVAAPAGTWLYRGQRLIAPFSRRFDGGCDPSRRTWTSIERAPFRAVDMRWFGTDGRLAGPFIAGYAEV